MIARIQAATGTALRRIATPRFLKFGLVGASGVVVNQGVLYLAQARVLHVTHARTHTDWLLLNAALALAIFLATLNNFIWNRAWTWADRPRNGKGWLAQFGQYVLACWVAIILQMALTNLLARHFEILAANLVSIVLTSAVNFLLNDVWTFGRRTPCQNCLHEP
jgi:putative flippase GtrA